MLPGIDLLLAAARAGGDEAKRVLPAAKIIVEKDYGDFATTADLRAQEEVLKVLSGACPAIPIIAEEDEHHGVLPESFFTVDPLDGTIVASRGAPEWGTLISYVHQGQPALSVLYQPQLDRVIDAERGSGSFYSDASEPQRRKLKLPAGHPQRLIIGFELTFAMNAGQAGAALLPLFESGRLGVVRAAGAAIHAGFELVLGRTDAYVNLAGAKIWDFAPLALAVEEAGGACLRIDPDTRETAPLEWNRIYFGAVMARSSELLHELIGCIRT